MVFFTYASVVILPIRKTVYKTVYNVRHPMCFPSIKNAYLLIRLLQMTHKKVENVLLIFVLSSIYFCSTNIQFVSE